MVNLAELFLLRAFLSRQLTGDGHNLITEEHLLAAGIEPKPFFDLLGYGNIPLSSQAEEYDGFVQQLEDFGMDTFRALSTAFQTDDQIESYSVKRFETIGEYGNLEALHRWAAEKANKVYLSRYGRGRYQQIEKYLSRFRETYKNYQLSAGSKVAKKALEEFPDNPAIVRWWSLFRNRLNDSSTLRKKLGGYLEHDISDDLRAVCNLAIFESYLNQFDRVKRSEVFEELTFAKEKYMEDVPDKENDGHYHYFMARYEEEKWSVAQQGKNPPHHLTLSSAVNHIEKSIELYTEGLGGYQAIEDMPWWLYCHRCIIFKLWRHPNFETRREEYGELILELLKKPENAYMRSMHIYGVSFYLLKDDPDGLRQFMKYIDQKILDRKRETGLVIDKITAVDSFTFRHVDLIFYDKPDKQSLYYADLDNWLKKQFN